MIDKRTIEGTKTVTFSQATDDMPKLLRQAADLLEEEGGWLISIVTANEMSEPPERNEAGFEWAVANGLEYFESLTVTYTPD